MRLLTLRIEEPLPGRVLPLMAVDHGPEEAARRYRAVVLTTLRQLQGLVDTRLRVLAEPEDAAEAIRFWLLPKLAGRWQAAGSVFRSEGWEIDFGGDSTGFRVMAHGEVQCPFLGARWAHAAMLGLERGTHRVTGPALGGGEYFRAHAVNSGNNLEIRSLPELRVIRSGTDWDETLVSPLGPALKRAWEHEAQG